MNAATAGLDLEQAAARIVNSAREAQRAWAQVPLHERARALKPLRKRILEAGEKLAERMWQELRKPWGDSFTGEVIADADLVSQWLKFAPRYLRPRKIPLDPLSYAGKRCRIELVPKGVVALITPWNMPVAIPLRTIVPALLAGNAVVWKPSEYAVESGRALFELFEGLLPPQVLQFLPGDGVLGAALVAQAVDHVAFTGSVKTGRRIAVACAERGITVGTELGGKDAAIVLADAPLERTAQGIVWGAFNMSGQNCASIERVIVERALSEKLIARVIELTQALRFGPDYGIDTTDVGPLATDAQLATVERHVEDAKARGAKVLAGGTKIAGTRYFAPTVLTDVPQDAPLWREETFGPVLPIVVVDSADDALRLARDSRYGLGASVWTRDIRRGEALARELDVGVAMVNNACFTGAVAMAAWGGSRDSGPGATNSEFALYALVRPKTVLVDRTRSGREMWWYPFNPALREITTALAKLLSGRVTALGRLLKWLPRRFR